MIQLQIDSNKHLKLKIIAANTSIYKIQVGRSIETYGNFNHRKNKAEVIGDCMHLQIAQNNKIFNEKAELFVDEWQEKDNKFSAYLWKECLDTYNELHRCFILSHDKSIERTNEIGKLSHTIREHLPIKF